MSNVLKHMGLLTFSLLIALSAAESFVRVAASFSADVRFLATAGTPNAARSHGSLEEFIDDFRVHLIPHRDWYNYYANSLGFTDREFSAEKPAGSLRIMALGDSFVYGMVAYPQNVMTLVEDTLRRECRHDVEVMNFGVPGSGVVDYLQLYKLAAPRYKPDIVVVHFYMGNDGPQLIFDRPPAIWTRIIESSYAWNYAANSIKTLLSVERAASDAIAAPSPAAERNAAHGGTRVRNLPDPTDRDFPPSFTEDRFASIAAYEADRLYSGKIAIPLEDGPWKRTLDTLDAIRTQVATHTGRGLIIVLYPSALQVYPQMFEFAKQAAIQRAGDIHPAGFDPALPSRIVLAYCRRTGLSCIDVTPALTEAAAERPDPLYHPRNTHWNIRGNRIAAEAEAAFLQQELCRAR